MQDKKDYSELRHKILNIVGIVLCAILIPILIVNCTLLIKGWTNKNEVPSIGGMSVMIVMTPSMEGDEKDSFNSGDLIFIKMAKPEDVENGQVITFYDPDGTGTSVLTHRLLNKYEKDGKVYFQTKGDANNVADPTPAPAENLIGIYTGFRIPGAGSLALFMQSTPGFILCVFVPALLMVTYDLIRRKMYEKKHASDKDELLRELEELRKLKAQAEQGVETKTPSEEATAAAAAELGVRSEEVGVKETNTDTTNNSEAQ